MKKLVLIVDNEFVKKRFIDMKELKLFKDIPIELITKVLVKGMQMELEKKDLSYKDKKDKISMEVKEKFVIEYMENKALLTMFALAQAVTDVKVEDID